jgi:hypothetical protein
MSPTGVAVSTLTPVTSAKMNLKLESVNGSDVAVVADANVIGGVPVIHRIAIADVGAPTNTDVVLTNKTKIIHAWAIKDAHAGGAGDKVSLYNVTGAAAITNDIDLNVADKTLVAVTTIDDDQDTIAAGGTLRVIATKATHCDCVVFVLGVVVT